MDGQERNYKVCGMSHLDAHAGMSYKCCCPKASRKNIRPMDHKMDCVSRVRVKYPAVRTTQIHSLIDGKACKKTDMIRRKA